MIRPAWRSECTHEPLCLLSKIKMAYNPLGSILEGQKDFCLSLLMDCSNLPLFFDPSVGNGTDLLLWTGQLEAKDKQLANTTQAKGVGGSSIVP